MSNQIKSKDWEGVERTLVNEITNKPMLSGAKIKCDDERSIFVLSDGKAPHKPSSSGRVYGKYEGLESSRTFFPSVIGAKWI